MYEMICIVVAKCRVHKTVNLRFLICSCIFKVDGKTSILHCISVSRETLEDLSEAQGGLK